jgi:hypothetical protein
MEKSLSLSNIFFMIPSWGNLIGNPTLGKYIGQDVSSIISDPVIFFGGMEAAVATDHGILYFIFGLGYYNIKFEIKGTNAYTIDHRELTAVIFPDFIYDSIATLRPITLENDPDVVINDKAIKTPIDLSHRTNTQKSFIQGALTRNVFIPNKDIIINMIETIQQNDTYDFHKQDHKLLCALPGNWDNIVVSDKMKTEMGGGYFKGIPGIAEIQFGAELLLEQYFNQEELEKIANCLVNLKETYAYLTYDPMYLHSILENAFAVLGIAGSPKNAIENSTIGTALPKSPLLYSGLKYNDRYSPWPENIKRQTKLELGHGGKKERTRLYSGAFESQAQSKIVHEFGKSKSEDEKFELKTQTNQFVASKPLPEAPKGNIEEILLYIKYLINENFEMRAIGDGIEKARDNIRKITLMTPFMFEMGKVALVYQKKEPNQALNIRDKQFLIEKLDNWLQSAKNLQ